MKKLIFSLLLTSGITSIAAQQVNYDDQYFKDIQAFFISLQTRYPLSICTDQVSLDKAPAAQSVHGQKIASFHWNIVGLKPGVVVASVTFNSPSQEYKMRALKEIDNFFTEIAKKDSHIKLRRQTTTPVGDPIAHYQNPHYDSAKKIAGGQGKIVEVRLIP